MKESKENTEKEKKDILLSFQKEINQVKENFEKTKNFYEQQKLLFQTEQSAINASSFLDKMKHVIENKSNVFKNLMEQNYFILKKKLKECDDLKELDNFSNKSDEKLEFEYESTTNEEGLEMIEDFLKESTRQILNNKKGFDEDVKKMSDNFYTDLIKNISEKDPKRKFKNYPLDKTKNTNFDCYCPKSFSNMLNQVR